jgi:hypothetical protein
MKTLLKLTLLFFLFSSCQSTQKLFDKGEYAKAYYAAVNDLKKNPSDANAQRILPIAYQEAATKYEQDITAAKDSKGKKGPVLDLVYDGYESLQKMYDAAADLKAESGAFHPNNNHT